ncbi:HNH endonuclease [Ancylobacter pratisalsi]|uniref:Uncharacterized protein n=1 Tax=Ancylobacter pratisalsi TaxID=1745854 RepID=A0A6P1YWR1_9HYPH|nr:HNH endonuclease [Ancylobacter pratisalsi]QIB36543.1 hypothetical protein G3A50_22265 [Ancylobacter pratisalsi]
MTEQRTGAHARSRPIVLTPALAERFWQKVDVSGGPHACWLWKGARCSNGYGHISAPRPLRTTWKAHRVSYLLNKGDPIGWCVCHRCDVPMCVNPAHLFLGTVKDNTADMLAKGRPTCLGSRRYPRLAQSVLRGEQIASAKLTASQVSEIRARAAGGANSTELGVLYGVDSSTVRQIVRREIWRHVE